MKKNTPDSKSLRAMAFGAATIGAVMVGGPILMQDKDKTRQYLENQGYTQIDVESHRILGCKNAYFANPFKAVNDQGKNVSGLVCRDLSGYSRILD